MKTFLVCIVLSLASVGFANQKISKEFAVVKACNDIVIAGTPQLYTVYDASVSDSGISYQVALSYKDGAADCTASFWYLYDGTPTQCDSCQGMQNCACPGSVCTVGNVPYTNGKNLSR